MRTFWLFTVHVRALEGPSQSFPLSSLMWLQVLVPAYSIEDALVQMQSHVASEHFELRDVTIARRYDLDDGDEEYPSNYVKEDGETVVRNGAPTISLYITNAEDYPDA